ncbi:MAG: NAD-dependent epimerase/dehydratase family protein [Pirellulaceae bacterium]
MAIDEPIRLAVVTGGGGFLGRYIVEALVKAGARVRIYGRREYSFAAELGVEVVRGDITDQARLEQAFAGADTVMHTAAIAGIWGKWQEYYATNTIGTQRVIAACQQAEVPRLVYTSSPSVIFGAEPQAGIDETVAYPRKFLAPYPHTKALAEQDVLQAHDPPRLWTCALRPHLIWGPRDTHLFPRLVERARAGQLRRIGTGENRVDTVYVENAAIAHLQAARGLERCGGKAYFITQGEPVNCWEWVNRLLGLAGEPAVRRSVSFRTAWIAGAVLERIYRLRGKWEEPRMTRFLAAQLALDHYYSIAAATADFGYEPAISTEEGMERYQAWLSTPEGRRSIE